MRFHTIPAALVAVSALISGAAAASTTESEIHTTTLTRTLQRVVQTVTATLPSSGMPAPTGDGTYSNATAIYTTPSVTVASTSASQTGAAVNLRLDTAGLAAVAGLVGYLAL